MSDLLKVSLKNLISELEILKKEGFELLIDICCKMTNDRFIIDYRLRKPQTSELKTIRIDINQNEIVPSVAKLFNNAELMECELFDLFGVSFEMHPNLRKVLTDESLIGHPLRKDFIIETEIKHNDIG